MIDKVLYSFIHFFLIVFTEAAVALFHVNIIKTSEITPASTPNKNSARRRNPGSLVLCHLSWVTCARITCSALGSGNFEGGTPMGSLVTLRVRKPWDHWAGSMPILRVGNPWDHWAGPLGGITGRDHW